MWFVFEKITDDILSWGFSHMSKFHPLSHRTDGILHFLCHSGQHDFHWNSCDVLVCLEWLLQLSLVIQTNSLFVILFFVSRFVALAHLYRRYAPELGEFPGLLPFYCAFFLTSPNPEEEKAHQNRHLSIPFRPDPFRGLSVTLRRAILLTYLFFITAFPVGLCISLPWFPFVCPNCLRIVGPGFAIYWNRSEGSSLLIVMTILWFVTSLLLQLTMPIQYVPEKFSIPWYTMPWTSSVAIFAIIVIIGGFGANKSDYYRLFSAMGIGTVVYLLYSLPANSWRFHESDKTTLTEQELAFRDEGK